MRIAQVAEDVEVGHRLGGVEGARARTAKLARGSLDPKIVQHFAAHAAEICAAVEVPSVWEAAMAVEPKPHREIPDDALDEALSAVAAFADLKSKYTRGHSAAVGELASGGARQLRLGAAAERDLRRAGLLHDIGRVAVSAGLWDKPGPLTDVEREKIRMHTYVGERVLARATALASVAEIATLAHERLDGTGYHRRLSAASCPPTARLLAAADVYRALVEARPHRPARSADQAAAEASRMAAGGSLCPDASRAVLEAAGHASPRVARASGLTDREVEVLRLLARGLTNKEIASALDIATKTAGHHVQHLFEKLGVTTRAAAAVCAMNQGISSA
jgi:HD-GYP domain-containing protein (c-di-GMP phosphodiesterase class II)